MSIYQHYREEEHALVNQALSWKEKVEQTYLYHLTDFLDPREQQIVREIVGTSQHDLKVNFHGGVTNAERKRAIIAPFYEEHIFDSYQLTLLEGTFNAKFLTITHRDVLGAFLSLGLKRRKIGDIIDADGKFQLVIGKELKTYVIANFRSVKNANISLKEQPFTKSIQRALNWADEERVVSSFRLDTMISAMYRMSRQQAIKFIQREHIKVNFQTIDDPTFLVEEGDLISVRGKGRGKFLNILGKTRKNHYRIEIARLKT